MIQNLINNRLQLSSVRDKLYNLCKTDINNLKQFENYVVNNWNNIDRYNQHLIAQLLAGNSDGKGKNIHHFEKYIETILQYAIR